MLCITMDLVWLTHLEALAICFASSGVILMMTVYFIVRSSSTGTENESAPAEDAALPMDLEAIRAEGYYVLEVYDDTERRVTMRQVSAEAPSARVIRTAKVLDPETGTIRLMKVQMLVKPW